MGPNFADPCEDLKSMLVRQKAEQDAIASQTFLRLDHMYDQLGWLGQKFKAACLSAPSTEHIDFQWDGNPNTRAVIDTFHTKKGFLNAITYNWKVLTDDNLLALFSSRTHEKTHLAFQFAAIAGAHATPFNHEAKVVLCPRDAMILNVLMERQAFAVELMFEDLMEDVMAGGVLPGNLPPENVLQAKLQSYTQNLSAKWGRWDSAENFSAFYQNETLNRYDIDENPGRVKHLKNDGIIYARLGLKDLRLVNDFLGLKTFAEDDGGLFSLLSAPLSFEQQQRLSKINADLGIWNESALPFIENALCNMGTTYEQFVADSRNNRLGPNSAAQQSELKVA